MQVHELEVLVVLVAALGLVVASMASQLDRLPVSGPLAALVVGVLVGPQAAGWVTVPELGGGSSVLRDVALVLLAVSMAAISMRYPWGDVVRRAAGAGVLVGVVMPVMALASAGVAWAVLGPTAGVSAGTALLLGAAVCPTDPVLSSSVVTGELAERDVAPRTRQLLSLESGANDGLALPLVVVAIAVAGPLAGGDAAVEVVRGVLGAVLLGVVAGAAAGWAVRVGQDHAATQGGPVLVFTVVLALGVLAAARLLEVGEVLAVLVAGLALNATWPGRDRLRAVTIDEAVNRYAVLPFFLLLGVALPWGAWAETGWPLLLLVVGVLLLRRLPWLLLLARPLRLRLRDAVFLGWYGPIGVSGLYYLLEVGHRVPGSALVVTAGTAVVAASTVVHGLSSSPGRVAYARAAGERG